MPKRALRPGSGVGEALALPDVSEEQAVGARSEAAPAAAELDTAILADRIISAAERGDDGEMKELSALARRKVGSATPDADVPTAGGKEGRKSPKQNGARGYICIQNS